MKLAVLALVTTLGLAEAAHAEPVRPGPAHPNAELKQALLDRFDANHDGRLEPAERRRAIRALRRLERRMTIENRRELGAARPDRALRERQREQRIERREQRIEQRNDQPVEQRY